MRTILDENNSGRQTPQRCDQSRYAVVFTSCILVNFPERHKIHLHGIAILSHLLTHMNPSSSENLLLDISDLTLLKIGSCETIINYMSRIHGISQRIQQVLMEKIVPLFAIAGLDHDFHPNVRSRYLAGRPALVNFNLLNLNGLLSSE